MSIYRENALPLMCWATPTSLFQKLLTFFFRDGGWRCTLVYGHDGDHMAEGVETYVCHRWKNTNITHVRFRDFNQGVIPVDYE